MRYRGRRVIVHAGRKAEPIDGIRNRVHTESRTDFTDGVYGRSHGCAHSAAHSGAHSCPQQSCRSWPARESGEGAEA